MMQARSPSAPSRKRPKCSKAGSSCSGSQQVGRTRQKNADYACSDAVRLILDPGAIPGSSTSPHEEKPIVKSLAIGFFYFCWWSGCPP